MKTRRHRVKHRIDFNACAQRVASTLLSIEERSTLMKRDGKSLAYENRW